MGISRATASKWVKRYKKYGELGLLDRSSAPIRQPSATPGRLVEQVELMRPGRKCSASRIAFELDQAGTPVNRRTVTRLLAQLGLNRQKFIDPNGEANRTPQRIDAERPGSHDAYRREEGRTHSRRRRLARLRERQPGGESRCPYEVATTSP
jgi:transposase